MQWKLSRGRPGEFSAVGTAHQAVSHDVGRNDEPARIQRKGLAAFAAGVFQASRTCAQNNGNKSGGYDDDCNEAVVHTVNLISFILSDYYSTRARY